MSWRVSGETPSQTSIAALRNKWCKLPGLAVLAYAPVCLAVLTPRAVHFFAVAR
jgi:hypothetical protein